MALTHRTTAPRPTCSGGGARLNQSGNPSRSANQKKQAPKAAKTSHRHAAMGPGAGRISLMKPAASGWPAGVLSDPAVLSGGSGNRNIRHFSRDFTAIKPAADEQAVASSAVPMMADGFVDPAAARTAMAVMGINWTDPVLIARKVHMAFVAAPGFRLSDSRSFMARSPSGVAAFTSPSMFAAM